MRDVDPLQMYSGHGQKHGNILQLRVFDLSPLFVYLEIAHSLAEAFSSDATIV